MQKINADEFVKFIIYDHAYTGTFDFDMKQIKLDLWTALKKKLSETKDVLNFMLNDLGYEFQIPNSNTKFTCYDYFQKWLNQIENQNKNVPNIGFDTTDILIAILAFTGTGISWIIWSLCNPYRQPIFKFVIGVINILISGLFVCSISFGWGLAVQIILGILFSSYEICTIIATIRNVFEHRESRRRSAKHWHDYIEQRIPNMKEYLEQVKSKSEQDKNNKSDKKNEKIENELGNIENSFPDSQKFENENDKKK